MGTAEELAFLLQDSGLALVDASDVLQAVDRSLAERNKFMPKGMSEADAWMARHGNPLASTESAMLVAHMVPGLLEMKTRVSVSNDFAEVILKYQGPDSFVHGDGKAETLPIAICAAVMDALDKKGKVNV
jgi:hypothetical protein